MSKKNIFNIGDKVKVYLHPHLYAIIVHHMPHDKVYDLYAQDIGSGSVYGVFFKEIEKVEEPNDILKGIIM